MGGRGSKNTKNPIEVYMDELHPKSPPPPPKLPRKIIIRSNKPWKYKDYLYDNEERIWYLDRKGILRPAGEVEEFDGVYCCCMGFRGDRCIQLHGKCCSCCYVDSLSEFCNQYSCWVNCQNSCCCRRCNKVEAADSKEIDSSISDRIYDPNKIYLRDTEGAAWFLDEKGILQKKEEKPDKVYVKGKSLCEFCNQYACWVKCQKICCWCCRKCDTVEDADSNGNDLNRSFIKRTYDPDKIYLRDTEGAAWFLDEKGILRRKLEPELASKNKGSKQNYDLDMNDPRLREVDRFLDLNEKVSENSRIKYIYQDLVPWTDPFYLELLRLRMEEGRINFRHRAKVKSSKSCCF